MSLFAPTKPKETFAFTLSDAEWRQRLSAEQDKIMRSHGTERACTSPLNAEKRQGVYHCAGCEQALFNTSAKFESGTGWPSFYQPVSEDAVATTEDRATGCCGSRCIAATAAATSAMSSPTARPRPGCATA